MVPTLGAMILGFPFTFHPKYRCAILQCQLDSGQDGLLIVLQRQGKNFHHLAIGAWQLRRKACGRLSASDNSASGAPLRNAPTASKLVELDL